MDINFNGTNADLKHLYDKYSIFTDGNEAMSIEYLAAAVSVPTKTAIAELQALVAMGYFGRDAYIDYFNKMLIIRSPGSDAIPMPGSGYNAADIINTVKNTVINNVRAGAAAVEKNTASAKKKSEAKKPARPRSVISSKPYVTKGKLTALLVFGILFVISSLTVGLVAIESLVYGFFFADEWSNFLITLSIGVILLFVRHKLSKLNSHFIAYRTIIGTKGYISIDDLADAAGLNRETVKKDLQKFIEKGLMGKQAYIDHGDNFLVLSHDAYEADNPAEDEYDERAEETEEDTPTAGKAESQYYTIIKEIRELNLAIADLSVSARVNKIEEITAKIFRIVEDKPEKLPQIKSFMSYYLPTTLKLLRSYVTLERQGVGGENIDAAKKNIEGVLDNIVKGFSQQLDLLFKSDYLDISTDIEVLEAMMAKDGLGGGMKFETEG